MSYVAFQALGTAVSATTGTLTVAWPTHQPNDIALLFVTSSAGGTTSSLTSSQGFTLITSFATGSGTSGTKLSVLWARADRTSMGSPVVAGGTDFKYGVIATFRGVRSTGSPVDIYDGNTKGTASTSASISDITTTVANAMIVNVISSDLDSASAFVTSYTNANLTNLTKRHDAGTTNGGGGGISFSTGTNPTASATGTTDVVVTSSINAFISIALAPEVSLFNTFEGGADTSALSSGNTGGASGTYLLTAPKNTGTTLTFSATRARNSLSYCASYAIGAAGYVTWAWTTSVRSVMRFYVYFESLQTNFFEVARFQGSGQMAEITMNAKQLIIYDSTSAQSYSPYQLQTGTWYRMELAATVGTTTSNGRIEFAYYDNDDTSPIFTYDSGNTVNTGTVDMVHVRLGAAAGPSPDPLVVYYDDLTVQELGSGFVGPSVPGTSYKKSQFTPFFS
ncbi:MAG: hypothetical protein ACOH18_01395 [Candidatus Saccharimonadaceae bacterium]